MDTPSDHVLYFPTIEFQSDNWVKSSLLYWDKIYRIVPEDHKPNDSELVREAQEMGFIENIILKEKETRYTADKFLQFIDGLGQVPAGLDTQSGEFTYVHEKKIDSRLRHSLKKFGNIYNEKGWLNFPKELAKGYMFYLATAVAKNRGGFSMSTDNPDNWVVSSFFTENGNFNNYTYDRDAEGYYSSLMLNGFIPADLSEVSLNSIIEFLEDEKEQKERFRSKLSNFTSQLSRHQDQESVNKLIETQIKEIENAKNDLKNSLSFIHNLKSCSYAGIMLGIPVAACVLEHFGGSKDPFNYYRIGESLTIGAVAAYHDYSQAIKNKKQNSFASYLVDVDKRFARPDKKGKYFDLGRSFNEFVND